MSDTWLVGRARELRAAAQSTSRETQLKIVNEVDALLEEAERRGDHNVVADLLRSAITARINTTGLAGQTEPLINRMIAHSGEHALVIVRANAHALHGRRLTLTGREDAAVTEVARALAILDDLPEPRSRSARRALGAALVDCWIVLNELGLYEPAEEVSLRTHHAMADSAGPHEVTLQMFNLIEMLLAWAIRLQRVQRDTEAKEKVARAAAMAKEVEAPFAESLFRVQDSTAIEQIGLVAAAVALHEPGEHHVPRLRRLSAQTCPSHERALIGIALARCLASSGRRAAGRDALLETRHDVLEQSAPSSVRLSIAWELAQLAADAGHPVSEPMTAYARDLEAELWALRDSRAAALQSRRAHERLSAEHGAIAAQAMQDPLTGLPNRRALDRRLRTIADNPAGQRLAVALVDLDGFKEVNDSQSHAEGDDVLRVIASTLRDARRGDDFVARYGGDEFVALLPGAPSAQAAAAMNRVATAVARLPRHLSRGVTVSVGLVSMAPGEHPDAVLARADKAMYQVKRDGGNGVSAVMHDDAEHDLAAEDVAEDVES